VISILAVSYNTLDWTRLLVQSIRKFTTLPYEIVIIDNNSSDGTVEWLKEQKDVRAILLNENIGHGMGLDFGVKQVRYPFTFVMDIDAHLQRKNWDFDLFDIYKTDEKIRLIAAKGGDPEGKLTCEENLDKWITANVSKKPIHACFQFFNTRFFKANGLSFIPREGHDVGRKNYFDIIRLGYKVVRIPPGYEDAAAQRKFYPDSWGDEHYLNGQIFLYHNWYSSRMWKKEKVDNLTREEFEERKAAIFNHPFIKDILATNHPSVKVEK